jgi:hypothetical protein
MTIIIIVMRYSIVKPMNIVCEDHNHLSASSC